jgi:TatD DNase family protein
VTFKKADNIRTALAAVPRDRLLLETDSPYLAPVPYRGKTNTPAYLPAIAERIAQELQMETEELANLTTANACRLFGILF